MLQIAKILKSNGTDGELVLNFREIDPEDLSIKEPVYIEFDWLPVPFFITSLTRKSNDKAFVHFNDVLNLKDAEEMVGRDVFSDEFEEEDGSDEDFSSLEGWTVKGVGTVSGFEDIPGNPCLDITLSDGREVIVPVHDDLIKSLDERRKIIELDIAEGLLD